MADGAPALLGNATARTQSPEFALGTIGAAGGAAAPAMPDEQVGEINPVRPGHNPHQGSLDFLGRPLPGEAEPVAEPGDMGVYDNALGLPVGDTQHDVGGLAADAIELNQVGEPVGNATGVLFGDDPAGVADGAGFVAEETGGANELFEFGRGDNGEIGGGPVAGEQGGGDLVDADIGALGAEDGGDEKLEGVVVAEGALGVGVGGAEAGEQEADFALGNGHGREYSTRDLARRGDGNMRNEQ